MAANVPCLPASWLSLWPQRDHVSITRILFIVSTGQPRQKPLMKASSSPRAVRRCSFAVEAKRDSPEGAPLDSARPREWPEKSFARRQVIVLLPLRDARSRSKARRDSLEGTARVRCQPYRRSRGRRTHRRRWEVIALYRFAMLVRGRRPDRRFPGGDRARQVPTVPAVTWQANAS